MAREEFNKYTRIDVPDVPTEDVSSIIQQQGLAAADDFIPLSDPTNALPTAQNIQPFDGDPVPFDLPGVSAKKHLFGYPDKTPGGYGVATEDDISNWIQSTTRDVGNSIGPSVQKFQYDAGPKTNSFYKRYAAYGDDKLSEIGFHPFVDNEANFVQRTDMWDDWSRMLTHSFPVLLKRGFLDGPKSLGKALMGDFDGADLDDAKEYAEAAAIGQSSREGGLTGLSAFMNNTVMNFGYTAGIITEALLEEVALSFMTVGSRGMTAGIQAERSAVLGKNLLTAFGKFGSGYKAIKNLLPKLAKTPSASRNYWASLRGTGRILNPLENTVDAIRTIRKTNRAFKLGKADSYINGLGIMAKTAGSLYRDVRAINMAVSESRLEAGMVENDIYKELYDDRFNETGITPTTEEQVGMRIRAKQGSLETFYKNAGIIYVTNQITFRNVVAPRGGIRNFMKGVQQDLKSFDGKYGSIGKIVYDRSKSAIKFQKNKIGALAKAWYREPGMKTFKKTLGYFKANVAEGIQENLQEIIARANIAHYVEAYKTEGVSSALYAQGVNGVSYSAQMGTSSERYWDEFKYEYSSKQGLETFMSGFLMGTFARPLNQAIPFLSKHYNRIYDKEGYKQWIKTKVREKTHVVNYLNEQISKKGISEFLDNRLLNLAVQEETAQILKFGGKKEALDSIVDSFVESVSMMREYNVEGVFIEKLESMLELTDTELADAVQSLDPEQAPKYRERISKGITIMKNVQALAKDAENLFPSPIGYNDIDHSPKGNLDPVNVQKKMLYRAWNKSVKNFIYLNAAFKDTAIRMESIYADYLKNTSLANVDYSAVKVLFKKDDVEHQLKILNTELETVKPNSKKGREIKKQIELLQNFELKRTAFNILYNIDENFGIVEKSIKKAYKDIDEKDRGDITDEEIISAAEQVKSDITEEKQLEVIQELKDAHDAYIRFLAKNNDSTIFQTNIDDGFNKLLDFYKLKYENRFLADSIDLLTDPGQFLILVEENAKKLTEFFKKYTDVNKEVVDTQVEEVEFDSLVKELQEIGLVFSTNEDMLNLQNNKVIPKTLTGSDNNEVYQEETPEYNAGLQLMNQFIGAIKVDSGKFNPITGENMTEAMAETVEKLNALFAISDEYEEFGKKYLKASDEVEGSITFSRVSNIISEYVGETYDYSFIPNILTNDGSPFEVAFYGAKAVGINPQTNEPLFKRKGKGDTFEFNKKTINKFIETLQEELVAGDIKGINAMGLMDIGKELDALFDKTERPSIKEKIDKLKKSKDAAGSKELKDLEKKLILEPTVKNVQEVLEETLTEVGYQSTRDRGNNLDNMVRDYFDSSITDFSYKTYKSQISENAFENLFGENGLLRGLKDLQTSGDIVIFSKNLTLGSEEMSNNKNVAGTMDLVIVDKKGKTFIVDLKTMKNAYSKEYGVNMKFGGKNFAQHSMQLLAYSNLLFNETGVDAATLILPITTTDDANGVILALGQPTESPVYINSKRDTIVKGRLFVDVNRKTKGENTKVVLGKELKTKLETIDINDIDTLVPRGKSKSSKAQSKIRISSKKDFTKKGNVFTLENKKKIDEKFLASALNKHIYVTLGIGGYEIVKNNPNDFAHTDEILEEILQGLGYARKKDERLNQYLYRFQRNEDKKSPLEGNRETLDEKVLEKVDELIAEGKTVISSSPNFIKNIPSDSVIIVTTANNENFINAFSNEQEAVNFLSKEQAAIKGKNDQTALQINEFKEEIEFSNDTLYLYKELDKKDFNYQVKSELRSMIDIKANSLLSNQLDTVNTSMIYTLSNDLKSMDLKMGDQVNVLAIDTKNRDVVVRESKAGAVAMNVDFTDFAEAITEQDIEIKSKKDKTNSEAVAEYLKGLETQKSKIDKKGKDFKSFDNKSDEDNFDIFKCG